MKTSLSREHLRTLENTVAATRVDAETGAAKALQAMAEGALLDPALGSGHFLVSALHMLVPLRMADEGLTARLAVDRVLAENLHGLELDARCVEMGRSRTQLTVPSELLNAQAKTARRVDGAL